MKLNFSFMKKGSPLLWIGGAVVLFVIFYMLASKGDASASDGGGNIYTTATGPSDTQTAIAAQLSMAQLQANISANQSATELAAVKEKYASDVALGNLSYQGMLAEINASESVALYQLATEGSIAMANLTTQKQIAEIQSEYGIDTAEIAAETNLALTSMQADVAKTQILSNQTILQDQLSTNKEMFEIQSNNLIAQSLISQVSSLKKKDRDNALTALAGVPYRNQTAIPGTGLLN